MKWVVRIVGVLVVLLIVAVVVVMLSLNGIVKSAVQSAGSSATGVDTTLGGVNVGVFSGSASLNDFKLGNPEGFQAESAFELGSADVQLKTGSLFSDTVVVPKVHIDGAHVTVAFENGKLNLTELMKQIEENTGGADDSPADSGEGKNVIIEDLQVTNTTVTGAVALVPGSDPIQIDLKIADIHKTGIGSDGSGVKLQDAVGLILETIMLNATEGVAGNVPGLGDLKNMLGDVGAQATEALDKVGGDAGKALEGAGDGVNKALEGVGEGLGGLLGGNKDE